MAQDARERPADVQASPDESGRRSAERKLPMTSYATLGLLSLGGEFTAVEIEARANDLLRYFYWTPALSHIRRELDRLEELGYVTAREVQRGRVKRTLKYKLTESGVAALKDWVEHAPIDRSVEKNPTILRLWLGRRGADPQSVMDLLESHIEHLKSERAELTASIRVSESYFANLSADTAAHSPDAGHSRSDEEELAMMARAEWHNTIMYYCVRNLDNEVRNLKRLGDDLRALQTKYPSTMSPRR